MRRATIVGIAGLAVWALGLLIGEPGRIFSLYLEAYLFWMGITLGSLAVLMIHDLTGGAWGKLIRPVLESAASTVPWMALLFLPLVAGAGVIYPWAHAGAALGEKRAYLNLPFFTARAAVYFVVWAFILRTATRRPTAVGRSAVGLMLYVFTVTLAAVDWAGSLDPKWFSSAIGVLVGSGQVLSAFALAVTFLPRYLKSRECNAQTVHDLGNLLLMSTMFWAYIAFSQFLIIWAGQLPDEYVWYHERSQGGWREVGLAIVVFHFFVPFFLLLSRGIKRDLSRLGYVAVFLLAMRWVDDAWLVRPAFMPTALNLQWLNVFAMLGIGGLWLGRFLSALEKR